ncbi:crotonase/enoyl-CoA hydratase family protein [Ornithinimicrobium ciconiae]|uniref:Crotonase/enoyl-CoA hydratase family protein n=1 Tax=Ornithinimicrobium ciconiae TaxID=2594265 RepID=A0A516G600_9MICO|nr:crotonase/enoyl-CoA hydratase family protein [Ornithinimicrobium ciconiae]QDO86948.1 crotonase/enoyl-CoA hydratase family protein [Ornithinimicrobium ciconiae]
MGQHITCTIEGSVAHVSLARPDKLNALTLDMLGDLADTAHRLRADRTLRAVILSGEGESFCAGLDFESVLADRTSLATAFLTRPWRGTNTFQEACYGWRRLPVPVIAAVHGNCLGGGLQIALGADFRFTTADARWSVLEGKWGLIPDMAGVRLLADQVGMSQAKRLTMTAEIIDGTAADRLGLASVAADPHAAAAELAALLATRSPDALAAGKQLFETSWNAGPRATFRRERRAQFRLLRLPNTGRARKAAFGREHADYADRARR